MFGWTLLDAMLGGDLEALLAESALGFDAHDAEDDEPEGDLVLPDYAES